MQRPADDSMVTTAEAAFLLGVSVATVNRWALTGRLTVAQQGAGATSPRLYWRDQIEDELRRVTAERNA